MKMDLDIVKLTGVGKKVLAATPDYQKTDSLA